MIVVIQCAARKRPDAGRMVTGGGMPVEFVADPQAAPDNKSRLYARPDDPAFGGKSWRQLLMDFNTSPGNNPLGIYPAYNLYENGAYGRLVERFGISNVFILSAGWGLIRGDFLTPYYDITFSKNPKVPKFKRRHKSDRSDDFRMLPNDTQEEIIFFGGKDYLLQFCKLTAGVRGKKNVFFNSIASPRVDDCVLKRFETTTRTNWHYECVDAFLDGKITV